MIIYTLWLNNYQDDKVTCLLKRKETIKADHPIFQKDMELMIDQMVLTIEKLFINLEFDPPDLISAENDIEIDIYFYGGDKSIGSSAPEYLLQKYDWELCDGEIDKSIKYEEGQFITSMRTFEEYFKIVQKTPQS